MGCDFGGALDLHADATSGTDLALEACELIDGVPMTGHRRDSTTTAARDAGP